MIEADLRTDTATLVLFDASSLADKVDEECDWWTGPDDLDAEEAQGHLTYIPTGSDGFFRLSIGWEGLSGQRPMKSSQISIPSGRLYFGIGECLPGDGRGAEVTASGLYCTDIEPGTYSAVITRGPDLPDGRCHYHVALGAPPGAVTDDRSNSANSGRSDISPDSLLVCLGQCLASDPVQQLVSTIGEHHSNTSDDATWITCNGLGIELVFHEEVLDYIHLYTECPETATHEAFSTYSYPLPHGLAFGAARDEVAALLGERFKGTGTHWAIYRMATHGVRVGYVDGHLQSVNLLSLQSEIMCD